MEALINEYHKPQASEYDTCRSVTTRETIGHAFKLIQKWGKQTTKAPPLLDPKVSSSVRPPFSLSTRCNLEIFRRKTEFLSFTDIT